MTLCGARRGAGWSFRHNVKPGTPMGRGFRVSWTRPRPSGRRNAGCGAWLRIVRREHGACRAHPRCEPVGCRVTASPAFWSAVTLWRPSGPASHHRRGRSWVDWEGCDHADGTPAACLVAGRADRIALPEGARYDIVRGAPRSRVVVPAQCQTRHPDGAGFSACPGGLSVTAEGRDR